MNYSICGVIVSVLYDDERLKKLLPTFDVFSVLENGPAEITVSVERGEHIESVPIYSNEKLYCGSVDDEKYYMTYGGIGEAVCGLLADESWTDIHIKIYDMPDDLPEEPDACGKQALILARYAFETYLCRMGGAFINGGCIASKDGSLCLVSTHENTVATQVRNWINEFSDSQILAVQGVPVFPTEGNIAYAYAFPWGNGEQCTVNAKIPLAAITDLRPHSRVKIRQLGMIEAMQVLLIHMSKPLWDKKASYKLFETTYRLATSILFYRMDCTENSRGIEMLVRTINKKKDNIFSVEEKELMIRSEDPLAEDEECETVSETAGAECTFDEQADPVEKFLWNDLQKPITRRKLLADIIKNFDMDEKDASSELNEFLDMLREKDILEEE